MAINVSTQGQDVNKWEREIAPSHYILNIESFSKFTKMLSESGIEYYESKIFEASGYKWKFSVYPNGDANRNGMGHISVFLSIEETDALPQGWEIYADVKFFIFDQMRDKYSIFQVGGANRFNRLKTEWGIPKLVSCDVFDDIANGYLVNDKCVFGVEVFILDSKFKGEYLSSSVDLNKTFTWKVSAYSNLDSKAYYSDEFTAHSLKWRILLYPLGDLKSLGENLSLFLKLVDQKITCARLLVHFMIRIRNQKSGNDEEVQSCGFFTPKSDLGWTNFVPLTLVRDESTGFVVGNCMIIEAHIMNVYTIGS